MFIQNNKGCILNHSPTSDKYNCWALNCKPHILKFALIAQKNRLRCYDIKPVRKEEGKSYWKIPLCDDDATSEK